MKKIILFLLLLSTSGILLAQSTVDVTNTTSAVLDSAGVWQPTSWRNVTGYNSITLTIKSDKSSATNGVKIYWSNLVSGTYRIMDSVSTSYSTGTIFKLTLPIIAPYLKVKYTNTTSAQTTFSLVTMLHVGQQLKIASDGDLSVGLPTTTLNMIAPYNFQGASQGSVTTETDTITFAVDRCKWTVFAIDDTIEVTLHNGGSNQLTIFPYQSYTFDNFDSSVSTGYAKGYIRRKGTAGTANYVSSYMGL